MIRYKVFYVPELRNIFLSAGQLQEKGLAIPIQHGKCKFYHPRKGLIMVTATSLDMVFIFPAHKLLKEYICFSKHSCILTFKNYKSHVNK